MVYGLMQMNQLSVLIDRKLSNGILDEELFKKRL